MQTDDRKDKVRSERRQYHRKFLESRGCSSVDLDIKMAFIRNGRRVVLAFDNQFTRKNGMYFEITDDQHELVEPGKLFFIRPNKHYKEEFEARDSGGYYVPLEELEIARDPEEEEKQREAEAERLIMSAQQQPALFDDANDEPYSNLTVRDFAALMLRKPVSHKTWLNDIIIKHA